MNRTNYQTIYYTQETELASFAPLPQFLLRLDLSMTARVLYAQLFNRAKLSRQNGWIDDQGRVYVFFSEAEIGRVLHKGRSAVQQALHDLDEADLIVRERSSGRNGRRIYLKVLLSEPENPAQAPPENRTSHARESGPGGVEKPTTRNHTEKKEWKKHTEKEKSSVFSERDYSYDGEDSL